MKRSKLTMILPMAQSDGPEKFSKDSYVWKERTAPLTRNQYREESWGTARELDKVGDAGVSGNWWSRQRERWYR